MSHLSRVEPPHLVPQAQHVLVATLLAASLVGCGSGAGSGAVGGFPSAGDMSTRDAASLGLSPAQGALSSDGPAPGLSLGAPPPPPAPKAAAWAIGSALSGLTTPQAAAFEAGKSAFTRVRTPANGLGPVFNSTSCGECHAGAAPGGSSGHTVTRFGRTLNGVFDPLASLGGSLLQKSANPGVARERLPASANTVTLRRSTTTFGLGLIEAIPDAAILANAAAQKASSPAQAGLACMVTSGVDKKQHVGRFGWKCQHATALDFAGDAMHNELGISNPLFPFETASNGADVPVAAASLEDRPDAAGMTETQRVADFSRYLAPYPSAVAVQDSMSFAAGTLMDKGSKAFVSVGCAVCHTPAFSTTSSVAALNGRRVWVFSDLLLHDVGTGDGIVQGNAPATMLRTAPLIDIAHVQGFMHDQSAFSVHDAILRHAGQATAARAAYQALSAADQSALTEFVRKL